MDFYLHLIRVCVFHASGFIAYRKIHMYHQKTDDKLFVLVATID